MLEQILNRIEEKRTELGISQRDMLESVNLSKDTISNLRRAIREGNEFAISLRTIVSLAEALDVPPEWLAFNVTDGVTGSPSSTIDANLMKITLGYRDLQINDQKHGMRLDEEVDFITDKYIEIAKEIKGKQVSEIKRRNDTGSQKDNVHPLHAKD